VHWAIYVAAALAGCGVLLLAWMRLVEPRLFRVRRISLPRVESRGAGEVAIAAGRLPALKILHVTDTHFSGSDAAKLAFLRTAAGEECDFAFLTGDLIDQPAGLASCLALAEMLHPRLGAFAVLGGHDHFHTAATLRGRLSLHCGPPPSEELRRPNPVAELIAGLAERGVRVLEDESWVTSLDGGVTLAVVGLRDAFVFEPDYEAAWRAVPEGAATIVLAHSPDVLAETVRRGADLALFGHTHGGQVRLPLVGALVTRSDLPRGRARGVFREQGTICTLNHGVGAGRGTNIRLLCRPEVTVLALEP